MGEVNDSIVRSGASVGVMYSMFGKKRYSKV